MGDRDSDQMAPGLIINALVSEYVTMTRNGTRPYANGFGAAIVHAGMVVWGVDEEEAAERIDEMVADVRIARGDG